jgi:hypothetical protein
MKKLNKSSLGISIFLLLSSVHLKISAQLSVIQTENGLVSGYKKWRYQHFSKESLLQLRRLEICAGKAPQPAKKTGPEC